MYTPTRIRDIAHLVTVNKNSTLHTHQDTAHLVTINENSTCTHPQGNMTQPTQSWSMKTAYYLTPPPVMVTVNKTAHYTPTRTHDTAHLVTVNENSIVPPSPSHGQ